MPKKAAGDERSDSPARGLTAEDANRILEMESRMAVLEEAFYKSQEQLREARIRENGAMSVIRELVAHVVSTDKGECMWRVDPSDVEENPSAPDSDATARVRRLYQVYESAAQAHALPSHGGASFGAPVAGFPSTVYGTSAAIPYGAATLPFPGVAGSRLPIPVHTRPHPNGGGRGAGVPPVSSTSPSSRSQQPMTSTPQLPDESKMPQQTQLYNGSPMNQAYPTMQDGNTANGVPIRKAGESTSLSFVVDGMGSRSSQLNATSASMEEQQQQQQSDLNASGATSMSTTDTSASARPSTSYSMPQPQPQPQQPQGGPTQVSATGQPDAPGPVTRRTPMKPSWTQTPRILVVEDDLVYRQLSSKFLEKFGCVVETVENAQQGIEKMNKTKYDLVLMDIFFGPSMDGRKATSLIRQFDSYTPIISMTSNVQTSE